MAKKAAAKAEQVVFKHDENAMKTMLRDMIANPKKHRKPEIKDFLEPLWPLIEQALNAGISAGAIAQNLRNSEQLDVSDAAFRKFVKEREDAEAAGWAAGTPSVKTSDAGAKAAAQGKPKA